MIWTEVISDPDYPYHKKDYFNFKAFVFVLTHKQSKSW